MKFKIIFLIFLLNFIRIQVMAQSSIRPLFTVFIVKAVNNQNNITYSFIRIDSSGHLYKQGKQIDSFFNVKSFTKEINDFLSKEKVNKYLCNNNPPMAAPTPTQNKTIFLVSIIFKDDFEEEETFTNKTHYDQSISFDSSKVYPPLFKYLSKTELNILQKLIE